MIRKIIVGAMIVAVAALGITTLWNEKAAVVAELPNTDSQARLHGRSTSVPVDTRAPRRSRIRTASPPPGWPPELLPAFGVRAAGTDAFSPEVLASNPQIIDTSDFTPRVLDLERHTERAAKGDVEAQFQLGLYYLRREPLRAIEYFDAAADRGVLLALDLAARAMAGVAQDHSLTESEREAFLLDAYAYNIAALMFGHGPSLFSAMSLLTEFPDLKPTPEACALGIQTAYDINVHRRRLGLAPYPAMYGYREIAAVMERHGICV